MTPELREKLNTLPDSPGCYLMKGRGEILYVGKAINLKNRVRQYFGSPHGHSPKVRAMVERIDDFDIVLVEGELEALMLECNLIKRHRPYYNILLRDDKQYPYVAVDLSEPFPRLQIRRRMEDEGLRYFGPFKSATVIRELLDVARLVWPVRVCTKRLDPGKALRPCVHSQAGRCLAPCAGGLSPEGYRDLLDKVMDFLSGRTEPLVARLKERMQEAARQLNYEQAAQYRDYIARVEEILQPQQASGAKGIRQDVLAAAPDGPDVLVECLSIREGKLVGAASYTMPRAADEPMGEVLTGFILQHYEGEVPRELLLPCPLPEAETLALLLKESFGHRVLLTVPKRGDKKRLLALAEKNLQDVLAKRARKLSRTVSACEELAKALGLASRPRRIEGYDISNTQGAQSVASMVVMIDGVIQPAQYRHFRIKTVTGANDFASMHEVITRRLSRGLRERQDRLDQGLDPAGGSFSHLPDLILIDGGAGQLAFARDAMKGLGLDIPMFGLAKRLEEIILPEQEESILLDRRSDALHLIQRLRDEAHRFGIAHHRKLRARKSAASVLDGIPGVGPVRKKALLKHFKTIEELKNADQEQLSAVEGVGPGLARVIAGYFRENAPGGGSSGRP